MKKNKKELHFWLSHFGITKGKLDTIPKRVDRLNFRHSDLEDEQLNWITSKIEAIDQLDLDSTLITDEGIRHLTRLTYLRELRLKDCKGISTACLPLLNTLRSLELLHLGFTSINTSDLHMLHQLTNQQLLLVSSDDDEEETRQRIVHLHTLLPQCTFNVNHQMYDGNGEKIYT